MRRRTKTTLRATFDELLDAVEELPPDAQAEFSDLLRRRVAERARQRIAAEIEEARAEFARGEARPASVDEILREILP